MSEKKQSVTAKYTTGKGELTGFICLVEPSTKYVKEGQYSASILLDKKEGEALVEKIKEVRTEQFKKYGKGTKVQEISCKPYEIIDEDTGEATPDSEGRYILSAKAKAYIKDGKPDFKPVIYNAKCQPVHNVKVGSGTIARLMVELAGYSLAKKTGVSIKLKAVQIIDLVEYQGGLSAEACGFNEEEGFDGLGEEVTEEKLQTFDEEDEEEDF